MGRFLIRLEVKISVNGAADEVPILHMRRCSKIASRPSQHQWHPHRIPHFLPGSWATPGHTAINTPQSLDGRGQEIQHVGGVFHCSGHLDHPSQWA